MEQIVTKRVRLMDLPAAQSLIAGLNSGKSKVAYRLEIERFDDWLANRVLDRASVLAYVEWCEAKGLAAATVNMRLAAIRGLVREAEINGDVPYSTARPILAIRDRKLTRTKKACWLERDQVRQILDACDGTTKSVRDRALFALAVSTGLRRSELASLQWAHLKRRKRKFFLMGVKVKGGKLRDIIIQESAMKWLEEWQKVGGASGPMFKRVIKSGRIVESGISDRAISHAVEALCEGIGMKVAAHDLRRTYANFLDEAGVPIREIQKLLGHSSVKATERYLKPIRDSKNLRDDYFTF